MNKLVRKIIGISAILLPFLLALFSIDGIQHSISSYYWANDSVIFIATLVVCGSFLIFYEGYGSKDKWMSTISGICILLLVIFPCNEEYYYLFMVFTPEVTGIIHTVSAFIAFAMLGVISRFEFTKGKHHTIVHKTCAYVIWISLLGVIITAQIGMLSSLFIWFEASIIWAFGVSWLVKGVKYGNFR